MVVGDHTQGYLKMERNSAVESFSVFAKFNPDADSPLPRSGTEEFKDSSLKLLGDVGLSLTCKSNMSVSLSLFSLTLFKGYSLKT